MTDQTTTHWGKIALDPKAAAEAEALLLSEPVNWMEQNCFITDKDSARVPLRLNSAQLKVHRIKQQLRRAGKQVKLIILKARQMGITTEALGDIFCDANLKPNRRALIAAHKSQACEDIFQRTRYMQRECPQPRKEQFNNRKEVSYDSPHYSVIQVKTAGDEDLGRSGTVQYLHCSELAFWPHAEKSLKAAMQCVPGEQKSSDVTVVYESTANGMGGLFYKLWCDATPCETGNPNMELPRGRSGFIAIFIPWHEFEEYRSAVPADFERTEEEEALARRFDLDDAQLQWRRETIADKCQGDLDAFHQEYPATDTEAFLVSGRPVFSPTALRKLSRQTAPPKQRGRVVYAKGELMFRPETHGPIEIWEPPQRNQLYAIGGDTAEGLLPEDSRDPDAHSAHVLHFQTKRCVAKITGRYDPDEYGSDLNLLGRWYNQALLGVEVNNTSGGSVRSVLRRLNYPNLYYRETWDEDADKMTKKLGWYTDKLTRGTMLADLGKVLREGGLPVRSAETVRQLQSFVVDKRGRSAAMPGAHDDDVMSLGVAWQMVLALAAIGTMENPDETGIDDDYDGPGEHFTPDMVVGGVEDDPEPLATEPVGVGAGPNDEEWDAGYTEVEPWTV